MKVTMRIPAPPDSIFDDQAAQNLVGQSFDAKTGLRLEGEGTVIAAEVVDYGRFVKATIEWPADEIPVSDVSWPIETEQR